VSAWTGIRTVAECLAALDAIDVPSAKVQDIGEVLQDPQIQARGMVVRQHHPILGEVDLLNTPFRFSGCDTTIREPAPLMGQHNRQIAEELGFAPADIDAMVRDGVLYQEAAVADLPA